MSLARFRTVWALACLTWFPRSSSASPPTSTTCVCNSPGDYISQLPLVISPPLLHTVVISRSRTSLQVENMCYKYLGTTEFHFPFVVLTIKQDCRRKAQADWCAFSSCSTFPAFSVNFFLLWRLILLLYCKQLWHSPTNPLLRFSAQTRRSFLVAMMWPLNLGSKVNTEALFQNSSFELMQLRHDPIASCSFNCFQGYSFSQMHLFLRL